MAMREFGIPFEEKVIPLDLPETKKKIARHSGAGRLPVLHHGEITVWESLAILEYLAELFPDAHLWPKDPDARALARSMSAEMHAGFLELRQQWGMNLRRKKTHKPLDGPARDQAKKIEDYWRRMRASHGGGGPFLFGQFSAADAMYAPMVSRFDTYGGTLSPDTRAYCDAILATDGMRQWYAEAAAEPWPEPSPDE